jgi:hypothetical protein
MENNRSPMAQIDPEIRIRLRDAALFSGYTGGNTHHFYHYPGRFSPEFARAVIEDFSEPNDFVLDPFMGGGTSIVEGLALGRRMIGVDINTLGRFVADVRTTPLSTSDGGAIRKWAARSARRGKWNYKDAPPSVINLPRAVERFIASALDEAAGLLPRQRSFARCALLRLGQWALDSKHLSTHRRSALARQLPLTVDQLLDGLDEFVLRCTEGGLPKHGIRGRRLLLHRSAVGLESEPAFAASSSRPKLVVTSPPYPGIHMLYHRWQYRGRKETAAPYWIAAVRDGAGASFYTGGSRTPSGLRHYSEMIRLAFASVHRLIASDALVVQLVGFSDPGRQLPLYLDAMTAAGFDDTEVSPAWRRRLSRPVPHRRWYTELTGLSGSAMELLLIHRKRKHVSKRAGR